MRIAIDLRPIVIGIKRGIYFYTRGLWNALQEYDQENQYIGLESYPLLDQRTRSKYRAAFWDRLVLPLYLRSHHTDLLHLTSPNEADFDFTKGGRLQNYKVIVTIHDIIPFLFPKELLDPLPANVRSTFENQFIQALKADHLIAISRSARKDLVERFSVSPDKVSVVYQCNHDDRFRPRNDQLQLKFVREKYRLPKNFIFNPTGKDYHKNFDNTLEAFARLPKGIRKEYGLVSQAWLPDDELGRRRRLAEKLGVVKRVRFIRKVDEADLPLFYNLAALTLVPSRYEGFGLSPLESMASGTPVIAGNNSAQPEVCGDAALLVNVDDQEEIAETMKRFFFDQKLQQDLSKKGLARAKEFSQERRARETIEVYKLLKTI